MPFHAYAISNNVAYPADYRYLINFANRDVADQFWRAIQKAVADKVPQWDSVGRITPQLYTHNPALKNIIQSVLDPKVAPNLFDKIFFQLLASRDGVSSVGTIPTQAITDHINGRTFIIRSRRDPTLFWFTNTEGKVVLSRDDLPPTRFLIKLRKDLPYPNPVLIGSDDIVISVPAITNTKANNISTDNNSGLILSSRPDVFKFEDFTDSFETVGSAEKDDTGISKYFQIYKNDDNSGEDWELA